MSYQDFLISKNLFSVKKINKDLNEIKQEKEEIVGTDLRSIKGIGEKTIADLFSNGIKSVEKLKETPEDKLKQIIKSPFTLNSILKFIKE